MPTICVTTPRSLIRLVSERLHIHTRNESGLFTFLREVPIRDLERLLAIEGTQITSEAMSFLLREEIPITFLAWNGRCLGTFHPTAPAHGAWRLRQYQTTLDLTFALSIATRIIAAKIYNQRRVLQRLTANHTDIVINTELAQLDTLRQYAGHATTIENLRGYEGAAAARYFSAWARFLPENFPFERRSTRPPLNPVNACISFGATLLYNEVVAAIHARGLDPALGLLHATEDGRWSLALDLMEPFRPVLVEALALDVFSHQILNETHFHPREGGIYLNDKGRAKFIVQYERRMERQFMSEFAEHRTTLRQQIENSVTCFKRALETPDSFEAFLMN